MDLTLAWVALLPVQLALFLPSHHPCPQCRGGQPPADEQDRGAQLIGAFKEQLEMQRSLVELENTNIELHVDASRHLLTIAE